MFVNMYKILTCMDCLHSTSHHIGRVPQTLNNIDIDQKKEITETVCAQSDF